MSRLAEPLEAVLRRYRGDWRPWVDAWMDSPAGQALIGFVDARQAGGATVFPAQVLRALELTPLADTRVVIVGQDPYHGVGLAEGLAFSVPPGVRVPPSLRNIYTELARDLGVERPASGSLVPWAEDGVLLLNSALTVELGRPAAHSSRGWEALTDSLIVAAASHPHRKVFMLWGAHAHSKAALIESATEAGAQRHLVLTSAHPSPLSARKGSKPFCGNGHFGRAQRFLHASGAGVVSAWETSREQS